LPRSTSVAKEANDCQLLEQGPGRQGGAALKCYWMSGFEQGVI
jgi:hypothetical protein